MRERDYYVTDAFTFIENGRKATSASLKNYFSLLQEPGKVAFGKVDCDAESKYYHEIIWRFGGHQSILTCLSHKRVQLWCLDHDLI